MTRPTTEVVNVQEFLTDSRARWRRMAREMTSKGFDLHDPEPTIGGWSGRGGRWRERREHRRQAAKRRGAP